MIPVQNIYYMLAYAFQVLNENGYKNIETEQFDNVGELCAAILSKGVSLQLKRGLGKEYVSETEPLSSLRGKIDIAESIKTQSMLRKQLVCTYDDFTVNSYMNRIIKSTMELLIRSDISKARKKELRKLLVFFGEVEPLNVYDINWQLQYNRNNQSYRMLISICYLVVKGLLQSNTSGGTKLMDFLDEQRMCRLYERFILEYYRKEHPEIRASASQIFTYVKNKDAEYGEQPHNVSGMLLYAQTDESVQPNNDYHMGGNQISVRTLNLNCSFNEIASQLDGIVAEHFA